MNKARWALGGRLGLMFAAACFVFSPAFRGDWLWDDLNEVRNNPTLRDGSGLAKIWVEPFGPDYFPLKTCVQWLQWHLWGDARLGYHLTNTGLHLAAAILLGCLLKRIGMAHAYLGGFIFLVHPLAVESVAWVSELKNVLSLPLMLLSFLAYVEHERQIPAAGAIFRNKAYLASIALFLAALLCKTSVVVLPGLLLLHAWWSRGRLRRRDGEAALPFIGLALALGAVTFCFQRERAIAGWQLYQGGFWSRLAGAGMAIQFYLAKFVWPRGLLPIYPRWAHEPPHPAQFLPWLVLAAAVGWLWAGRTRFRQALFGLGWFGAAVLPVLGFIPMSFLHVAPVADHLAYLPMIGLIVLVMAVLPKETGQALAIVLCALLAVESRHYAAKFVNQETLWSYTLARNSRSSAAHTNFAFILRHDHRLPEAIAEYREALSRAPDDVYLECEFADTLVEAGNRAEAIAHYEHALRTLPTLNEARRRLAEALAKEGRLTEAIAQYREAARKEPEKASLQNSLGITLADAGKLEEAVACYRAALRLEPRSAPTENNLGLALAKLGRWGEAIVCFGQALEINPDMAKAHDNLGYAFDAIGRSRQAIAQFAEAARLNPADPAAHFNLGVILQAAGRSSEARAHFEEALRLRPGFSPAIEHLRQLSTGPRR